MTGLDLDLAAVRAEDLFRRLGHEVDTLALSCRICNRRVSGPAAMLAHERGGSHADVVDARVHNMTMNQSHASYDDPWWCGICGKSSGCKGAFADHLVGSGHREASKVESHSWTKRYVIRAICEELRRRNLQVPRWCPSELYEVRSGWCPACCCGWHR